MDLIEELRRDRESGARRLEAEYKAGLMSLARRFRTDESDAEELVNRTFAAVVEGIDDYVEQSAFFAWMCQILNHLHNMDTRGKARGMVEYPGNVPEPVDESAPEAIYRNLDATFVREAVDSLPEDVRKAVLLHYFMDVPVREAAKVLSVPAGTVAWRLHHARMLLAAKFGAAAKKSGGKALLLVAFALCALAATGAAVALAVLGGPSARAAAAGGAAAAPAETERRESASSASAAAGEEGIFAEAVPPAPATATQEENDMDTASMRSAALGAATALALAGAPPAASADTYQFIVSPANWSLETATLSGTAAARSTPPGSLDIREHVVARSAAMSLSSIKNGVTVISIR